MFHRVRADHKKTKQKKQLVCCLMFRSSSAYEVTRDKFLLHKWRATVHSIVSKAEGWKESVSVYLIRQQDQKKKKKMWRFSTLFFSSRRQSVHSKPWGAHGVQNTKTLFLPIENDRKKGRFLSERARKQPWSHSHKPGFCPVKPHGLVYPPPERLECWS